MTRFSQSIRALAVLMTLFAMPAGAESILYGIDNDGADDALITINTATGVATTVGLLGVAVGTDVENTRALAYHSLRNELFASETVSHQLFKINRSTGAGELVGPIGFDSVEALAYDSLNDKLYGVNTEGDDRLIEIDPFDGAGTALSEKTGTGGKIFGLAYDSLNDELIGLHAQGTIVELVTFNRVTGVASFLVDLGGTPQVHGLAYETSTDELFGSDLVPGELVKINRVTGDRNTVGSFNSGVLSFAVEGLAFAPAVPVPDADGDSVPDTDDNCTLVANGPNDTATAGPSQNDTNGDGYGNMCDADLNNDLVINGLDVGPFITQFGTSGPDADFNGDGVVNGLDVGPFVSMFGNAPGPSGQAP